MYPTAEECDKRIKEIDIRAEELLTMENELRDQFDSLEFELNRLREEKEILVRIKRRS